MIIDDRVRPDACIHASSCEGSDTAFVRLTISVIQFEKFREKAGPTSRQNSTSPGDAA